MEEDFQRVDKQRSLLSVHHVLKLENFKWIIMEKLNIFEKQTIVVYKGKVLN